MKKHLCQLKPHCHLLPQKYEILQNISKFKKINAIKRLTKLNEKELYKAILETGCEVVSTDIPTQITYVDFERQVIERQIYLITELEPVIC